MVVTNYRGIAIGNAIQKLLAIIIVRRLQEYLEVNDILPDTQNGFRQGRSTVDNLYILNAAMGFKLGPANIRSTCIILWQIIGNITLTETRLSE